MWGESYGSSQSKDITSLVSQLETGRQFWKQVSIYGSDNHKHKEWSSFFNIFSSILWIPSINLPTWASHLKFTNFYLSFCAASD